MARATAQVERTFTLTLTEDEADALHRLIYSAVIGSYDGPRGLLSEIAEGLGQADGGEMYDRAALKYVVAPGFQEGTISIEKQ